WYEIEVDWKSDNSIKAYLYNSAGSLIASTTATDSTHVNGGFGYTFWINSGAWDSYTSRPTGPIRPTVYVGAEQTFGGATWLAVQNAPGNTLPNEVVRLRLAIENSGLDISGEFLLEYAAKGVAPTCESVSSDSFISVPNQSACTGSPVCMATSSSVASGADTTDLLSGMGGDFALGEIVTNPDNQSGNVAVDQNYYTELEYAITPTIDASDVYCFRVTNNSSDLDYYAKIAELGLQFDPSLDTLTLNGGDEINLTPGTTTVVMATTTVVDFNGYTDLAHATATIYRSGVGASCTADENNCFILTTENNKCNFTNCSGNSCELICQAEIPFHADPTDYGTYEGQEWLAYAEVEDTGDGYDFASAPGVELFALRALQVDSLINYGSLEADSNTGANNASTTITNLGNVAINVDIEGTDLSDGGASSIPAEQQKVSTSTFTYSACVSCVQLSSSSAVTLDINLSKPSVVNPPVETDVFWGIAIPFGINSVPHTGTNIFTPISP
ncbi:MAG: MotA/TolQ/ExbB proton channel, partial [Patescibacteria group bacterium]|nr:MotA/TolQ/ExbB proton channel [Patescibacteria group bacterium]